MLSRQSSYLRILSLALIAFTAGASYADTHTWTGLNNNAWGNGNNWNPTATPANGDDVVYYAAGFTGDTTFAGLNNATSGGTERRANTITFNSNITSNFAIYPRGDTTGGTATHFLGIQGAGGITDNSANSATITLNVDVNLRANQDWTIATGNTFVANNQIRGAFRLDQIGNGTLVLNGNNTHSGGSEFGTNSGSTFNGTSGNSRGFTVIGDNNALGTAKAISRGSQIQAGTTGINIGNDIDVSGGGLRFGGDTSFVVSGLITLIDNDPRGIGNYSSAANVNITLSGGIDINDQNMLFQSTATGNQGGGFIVSSAITGTGTVNIQSNMGAGVVEYLGTNTYTGDTTIGGILDMTGGELLFDIDSDGTDLANHTNIIGAGTADFDGTFRLDLSGADTTDGNSWNIVNVGTLDETFDTNFAVTSTAGAFSDLGLTHQLTDGTNQWTFTESTGDLTLSVIPEPSTGALIALSGLALLRRRRRK